MTLTLRQMRALVTVARAGSLGRTASLLHLSQPALTVQLREAERALGFRLFDRGARGAHATEVGQEIVAAFARILADLDEVLSSAKETAERRSGLVRLAVLPSVGATVVPQALALLRKRSPGIRAIVRDAVARRVAELVKAGEAELGIGTEFEPDAALSAVPLFTDRLVAVLPEGHAAERRRSLKLREVVAEPLILMDPQSSVRALFDQACALAGLSATPVYEATYMSTAVGLVRAGLGIAVLPSSAVDLRIAPVLRTRLIEGPSVTRQIVLVSRAGRSLSPAAEAFVAALRDGLAKPGNARGARAC